MALENISNVPDVCSGMLRIAPRALQNPPSVPSPETTSLCGHSVPPEPPWEKILDPPPSLINNIYIIHRMIVTTGLKKVMCLQIINLHDTI